jgi:hypothetical protein
MNEKIKGWALWWHLIITTNQGTFLGYIGLFMQMKELQMMEIKGFWEISCIPSQDQKGGKNKLNSG